MVTHTPTCSLLRNMPCRFGEAGILSDEGSIFSAAPSSVLCPVCSGSVGGGAAAARERRERAQHESDVGGGAGQSSALPAEIRPRRRRRPGGGPQGAPWGHLQRAEEAATSHLLPPHRPSHLQTRGRKSKARRRKHMYVGPSHPQASVVTARTQTSRHCAVSEKRQRVPYVSHSETQPLYRQIGLSFASVGNLGAKTEEA